MAVWSSPDVLVLHLKRFEYRNVYWRDKLNTMVAFPLCGLDMSPFARMSQKEFVAIAEGDAAAAAASGGPAVAMPPIYDLFGVVNHYGSMAGGHYTAFTNSVVGRGFLDPDGLYWHHFDDSSVTRVEPHMVVTRAAYVLFYRRRRASAQFPTSSL
jgi:ubiquitin C-terminal hydrolase